MEESKKARLKIFLWDLFIRPIVVFVNIHQIKAILISIIFILIIIFKQDKIPLILLGILTIIYIYELFKYYKSGEFMYQYRAYKSGKNRYGDYRKVMKQIRKEKQSKEQDNLIYSIPGKDEYKEEINVSKAEEDTQRLE